MNKGPILMLVALLLVALGLWIQGSGPGEGGGSSSLDRSGEVSGAGPGKSAELPQGKESRLPNSEAGRRPGSKPGSKPRSRLATGPTWTPRNPWFHTRGIGRRTTPPTKGAVLFPDGTWLPVLNGVENPPPFPGFNRGYPYAPVIRIHRADDGTQWYIHADKTMSSPQNMPYSEGGKSLGTRAGWAVGNPYDKRPVVGPDGRIRYETRKSGKPKVRTGPGG